MMRFLLPVLTLVVVANLNGQTPEFVPGQAMLKFVAGSAADDAVTRAGQASPPNPALLEPVIGDLQGSVQLPLQVAQLSSGNWLVVSVDLWALAERSARLLRDREDVTVVQTRVSQAGEPEGTPESLEILVKFAPGSREDKDVVNARESGTAEPLRDLLSELEQVTGLSLSAALDADGIVLQIDLQALTLGLVEKLATHPDVESTQPNYMMRGFGR